MQEKRQALLVQIRSALAYPMLLCVLGFFVVVFVVVGVLPKFTVFFAGKEHILPLTTRRECDSRDALKVLDKADGVFLTGGNQLRLSTTLGGTKVASKLRRRNQEGMHIAGTSAGAAISH